MKVLLSIKPEYAEKILQGEKKFEFRKAVFKDRSVTTVLIYATMPVGKVIGEFEVDEVLSDSPQVIWSLTSAFSGITQTFFNQYFLGRGTAHAIKVKQARRFDQPLSLKTFVPSGAAPQSFCYVRDTDEPATLPLF